MLIQLHNSEEGRNNQNHAVEREMGFLANHWINKMTNKVMPKRLWGYGIVYEAELLSKNVNM